MIDKRDGIKMARRLADTLEKCNMDNCGKCDTLKACNEAVEGIVRFVGQHNVEKKGEALRRYTIELLQDSDFNLLDYFSEIAGNLDDVQSYLVKVSEAVPVPSDDAHKIMAQHDAGNLCIIDNVLFDGFFEY